MAVFVCSCSNRLHVVPDIGDEGVPVTIRVASLEQEPFGPIGTKGVASLSDACSVINCAVYKGTGEKPDKTQVNQTKDSESFGTLNLRLEEGEYHLVVLAHSCSGNPTMTNPSKIEFGTSSNKRITDTFMYSSALTVSKDMQPLIINLDRVVGKFELSLTEDSVPASVTRIDFDVTGGSFYLNSYTGCGMPSSSKYTDKVKVQPGDKVIELYTFVGDGVTSLSKLAMSAKDSEGQEVKRLLLENVPIARNRITRYKGVFFGKEPVNAGVLISLNSDWAGTDEYPFNN